MQETVNKAARNYKSTIAIFELDFILENATEISRDKPKSKRQEKFSEMIIMTVNATVFQPYFDKIKNDDWNNETEERRKKKIQYSITAIEPME